MTQEVGKGSLSAIILPSQLAAYLASTQTMLGQNGVPIPFWSSPQLPPGVLGLKDVPVTRVPDGSTC